MEAKMSAGKIIAYIAAAILIFFGVLFIWGAFGQGGSGGWIVVGLISVAIGLVLIFWAARKPAQPAQTNVTVNVDLPGNVSMDTIKCQSCGGALSNNDIKLVAGAPVVTCPYCGTTYQLTEEPKW
jgi:Na+/melibiose symporter-like transporter